MPSKLQFITELSNRTTQKLMGTYQNWTGFLRTAAWNYKYSFAEQSLIHAQRPDATACAPIELWNNRLRRWVKRGSKGIALIDDSQEKLSLRYVFDISDTENRHGEAVYIWNMEQRYEPDVIEALESAYGELENTATFGEAIMSAAGNLVDDNMSDYLSELMSVRSDSFLEELDDLNVEVFFKRALKSAVAYMIMTRCGVKTSDYLEMDDFRTSYDFNTLPTISLLGNATSDMAEMALREIGETVRALHIEERKVHKLANSEEPVQNTIKTTERGVTHGNDIYETRGLSAARPDAAGAADNREIWNAAKIVSEEAPQSDIHGASPVGRADGTSGRDRQDGAGARRDDDGAYGGTRGRDGATESRRPDEVVGADEQHQAFGGGKRAGGTDIQLNTDTAKSEEIQNSSDFSFPALPSEREQFTLLEQSTIFTISQSVIDDVLKTGGNEKNSALRILAKYRHGKPQDENIGFLKREYRSGGKGLILDGQKVSAWWDTDSGVTIAFGDTIYGDGEKVMLSWAQVETRIHELLELGEYATQGDLLAVQDFEFEMYAERIWHVYRDNFGLPEQWSAEKGGYPEDAKVIKGLLEYPETLSEVIAELEKRYSEADENDSWRWRGYVHGSVHYVLSEVRDLQKEPVAYTAQSAFAPEREYFLTQDEIDAELITGGGYRGSKAGIYGLFIENESTAERIKHLKYSYGTSGFGNGVFDVWRDSKGVRIKKSAVHGKGDGQTFTYTYIVKRIAELIRAGRFLSPEEIAEFEAKEAVIKITVPGEEKEPKKAVSPDVTEVSEVEIVEGKPDKATAVYSLPLGTKVWLGRDEYDIIACTDKTVTLYDYAFPLFNKELNRNIFERRLRETDANDHLITSYDENVAEGVEIVDNTPPSELERAVPIKEAAFPYSKGDTVYLEDGKAYIIENIGMFDIQLRDPTLFYPILRAESLENFLWLLEMHPQEREDLAQESAETKAAPIVQPSVQTKKANFRITDDELGYGGAKTKYAYNIAAIKILQDIEADNRFATPEEQEILSKYVGWGGVADVFDEHKAEWKKEYNELKSMLSDDEYRAARESVLNAHYTSPTVIKAIYGAIENMGFKKGNILEPACGIGNFFGLVPESMQDSKLYGVELDSITGRIAKQLYQRADIRVQGFETANLPDSLFDVAIGNVPFGNYKLPDKRYDKLNLSVHDYFFVKTLDKVRPGGIVAFVTSSFTMDKKNSAVRKYLAERADLIGAARLPNNAFLKNAGTEVVTDILFLQKRERPIEASNEDWVHLGKTEDGFEINQYFVDNPDMILGKLTEENTQYGRMACTVKPIVGADLAEQLRDAMANIHAEITEYDIEDLDEEENSIPADPSVRNYSYTLAEDKLYFRVDSVMNPVETSATGENRIRGMIELRDCVRRLIEYQSQDYSDELIQQEQARLNGLYDSFIEKYGRINDRGNDMAFSDDSSYPLLCSLEVMDDDGEFKRKADMFTKRTIRSHTPVSHVDTSAEALAVSIGEKAGVDLDFMAELSGIGRETLIKELEGVIFLNVGSAELQDKTYVTADEYLSGNVREKLKLAKAAAEAAGDGSLNVNVRALEGAQPVDLTAAEISVRLGATWIEPEIYGQFVHELLTPPTYMKHDIRVQYTKYNSEWRIEGKNRDYANVKANKTYGTSRASAYKIIEDTLNLRDTRVFDPKYDDSGNRTYVLNKKETAIARQKQELIKREFVDWIWKDPDRREKLCRYYNDTYNNIRTREYDGSHIQFIGMNPEIQLRPHQRNAVARNLYGGNTLFAHCVGAGKTYTMAAASMEAKRLGLCNKSMFVVPNHLTEQWAAEFLQLYPAANILVTTKKDFERKNRKKFCSRIATGDYDAVIIGHSQFEKLPMSLERQAAMLQRQIDEILLSIKDAKANRAENYTVKQMEKTRKNLEAKMKKLNDQSRKDDVVTFEELGVDRLFIDESHFYKNLYLFTKMRNVGGIAQTEAQKSSDLFAKCQYLDELTGRRGVCFATGTPISNSMVELYTIQRYLQYQKLLELGLQNFDAWAATFGETVTAIELAPQGSGFRSKTRFAKFYNIPELMMIYREVADIQTADMLDLPVPKAVYHNVALTPSELQKEMVQGLVERAEKIKNREVEPSVDNMLMITNDGRKLALDQRLMNDMLPDHPDSKAAACCDNIFRIWHDYAGDKAAQLVFSDLSIPKGDGTFNIYEDIRNKLIAKGIPEEEIAFIHDANTDAKKKALFAKVRSGEVRVLLGSTFKMGAGTNCQTRLKALHHIDCPWRPSDLEQRDGRIIRQYNMFPEAEIYRYVTKETFDAYMYQIIENKQRFISQIQTSKTPVRTAEDIDDAALSYAEVKAIATGNPYIIEKMGLEADVAGLKLYKSDYLSNKYELEDAILKKYPADIKAAEIRIERLKKDIRTVSNNPLPTGEKAFVGIVVSGKTYSDKAEGGGAILEACKTLTSDETIHLGSYRGFNLDLAFDKIERKYKLTIRGDLSYAIELGGDAHGNLTRLDNALDSFAARLNDTERSLAEKHKQMENAKAELTRPFEQESELSKKLERLAQLDALLNLDERSDAELIDEAPDEELEVVAVKQYAR